MKKSIYLLSAVMAIIFASCSKNADPSLLTSRSEQPTTISYADFGVLHNLALSAAYEYISTHPDVKYVEGDENTELWAMHNYVKSLLPLAAASTTLAPYGSIIANGMND